MRELNQTEIKSINIARKCDLVDFSVFVFSLVVGTIAVDKYSGYNYLKIDLTNSFEAISEHYNYILTI